MEVARTERLPVRFGLKSFGFCDFLLQEPVYFRAISRQFYHLSHQFLCLSLREIEDFGSSSPNPYSETICIGGF